MGWSPFGSAEKSDGETEKVSDVQVSVKTDKSGNVSDIMVNESRSNPHDNHTHHFDKGKSGWGSKTKGKG